MAFIKITQVSATSPGLMRYFEANGEGIVIANVAGTLYAFKDRCPHMGGRLSQGLMAGKIVTCPLHGSQFDVTTGEKIYGPAKSPIKIYPLKIEGDDVFADV